MGSTNSKRVATSTKPPPSSEPKVPGARGDYFNSHLQKLGSVKGLQSNAGGTLIAPLARRGIQHDLSDQNLASKHDLSVHDLSQHDLSQHDLSQHSLGQNDLSVHDLSQHDLSVHEAKGMRRSYRQPAPAPRNINLTSRSMNSNHPLPGTGSGAGVGTGGGSDIDSMERNMERNLEDNLSITERRTAPIRIVTGGLEKALEKVSYSYRADDLQSVLSRTSEAFGAAVPHQYVEQDIVSVLYAGKTKKGYSPSNARKPNQDSFLMKHDLKSSALVIACFDGHGQYGHDVSRFCKNYLEAELVSHPLFLSNLSMAITEVIYALDRKLLAAPLVDSIFSGTTMVFIVMQGTVVTIANVGDSRVVLGYSKEIYPETLDPAPFSTSGVDSAGTTPEDARTVSTKGRAAADAHRSFKRPANLQLSTDHKPDIPEERNRILKAGGRVKKVFGTNRVYLPHDDVPGLAMSRSLGDFAAHTAGVISVPQIEQYDLAALYAADSVSIPGGPAECDHSGRVAVRSVLLVATDGLYDTMSNDRAIEVAFDHWGDPAGAAEHLISESGTEWITSWGLVDDTTVCVVNLEHIGEMIPFMHEQE